MLQHLSPRVAVDMATSTSGPLTKKRGRPKACNRQIRSQGECLEERLRSQYLRNKMSALDVHTEILAAWASGTDIGNLIEACSNI
eukprot:6491485-Amphidinium_carterae.2